MNVFYVYQGDTYNYECLGGYVWSPKLNKSGHKNAGYNTMTKIKKNDFIFHNCNGKLMAISVAKTDCYDSDRPAELMNNSNNWNNDGYRIDTDYIVFNKPLNITKYKDWLKLYYKKNSAFDKNGIGKQQYMCELDEEHAIYLLEHAISLQENQITVDKLKEVLEEIVQIKFSDYDKIEIDMINSLIEKKDEIKPEWAGKKSKQLTVTFSTTGREIPKRNPNVAANALAHADYLCEVDKTDKTFLRKNGKTYTEPHHLIPISKFRDFEYSLDVMENIVSLCSYCHNLLHYGRFEDKVIILKKLYEERKEALETVGLKLTFEQLLEYYK